MRKILVFLVIVLTISGTVWGQIPSDNKLYRDFYRHYGNIYSSVFDFTDMYNAVPATSTESRFSAGRFDSYMGGFADTRGYNPDIGTFFFMGGFPGSSNIGDTDYLTPGNPMENPSGPNPFFPGGSYAVSMGLGKTINDNLYMAVYYGGSMVDAFGQTTKNENDSNKYDTFNFFTWRNRMAVLFGINGMGFRFDLLMFNPLSQKISFEDGKEVIIQNRHGSGFALTWGMDRDAFSSVAQSMGIKADKFSPYVKLGIKGSDTGVITQNDGKKMTALSGSKWGFLTGTGYPLSDTSGLWLDFLLGGQFKKSLSGDSEELAEEKPYRDGGSFGIGLRTGYYNSLDVGNLTIGFGPYMRLGSTYVSRYLNKDENSDKYPADNFLNFRMVTEIGLRYRAGSKFAFFTGAGLQILEFNLRSLPGGKDEFKSKEREWELFGIDWEDHKMLAGGDLGFGMTFNPNEYITFGFGLNSILDNLIKVNIKRMSVEAGPFWGADYDSISSWAASIFDGVKLDMTLSVRIPPDGIPAEERKTFEDYRNNFRNIKIIKNVREFREFRANSSD